MQSNLVPPIMVGTSKNFNKAVND